MRSVGLLVAVVALCGSAPARAQDDKKGVLDKEYFPLKQGTKWQYEDKMGDKFTHEITGTTTISEKECSVMKVKYGANAYHLTSEALLWWGVWNTLKKNWTTLGTPGLELKLGAKKGDVWDHGNSKVRIEHAGEETVTVPAGKFNAVKLVWRWLGPDGKPKPGLEASYWYGRGKGLIKREDGPIKWELVSFTEGK